MITIIAEAKPLDPITGWLEGIGPLGNTRAMLLANNPCGALSKFANVMSMIIGLLTIIAGLYFVFTLITGALSWLSAGGDKMATENAQKKITHGLIGLVIIIAAIFLVDIVGKVLGIDILNPGKFIYDGCVPPPPTEPPVTES